MEKVVKTTILLKEMSDFPKVNAVYEKCTTRRSLPLTRSVFPSNPPARATFAVAGLPKNGLIEIEAIALE